MPMEFEPGKELRIFCYANIGEKDLDLSELVKLSLERLKAEEDASIGKEKELFGKIESGISEWQEQAKETIRLRKAQEYLRTLPVHHTSNQWVENANDWYELSNMVYKLTYHVSKNTFSQRQASDCSLLLVLVPCIQHAAQTVRLSIRLEDRGTERQALHGCGRNGTIPSRTHQGILTPVY